MSIPQKMMLQHVQFINFLKIKTYANPMKLLEQLYEEDILSSWNIGSYNNLTAVSIKFMKSGHIGSPPVTGMRRKSQ